MRKRKSREEISEARKMIAERAARGDLAIPSAIKDIRLALDRTQTEFAAIFGLTRRQVAEMEAGKNNPTIETLNRIAEPFGMTVGFVPNKLVL